MPAPLALLCRSEILRAIAVTDPLANVVRQTSQRGVDGIESTRQGYRSPAETLVRVTNSHFAVAGAGNRRRVDQHALREVQPGGVRKQLIQILILARRPWLELVLRIDDVSQRSVCGQR